MCYLSDCGLFSIYILFRKYFFHHHKTRFRFETVFISVIVDQYIRTASLTSELLVSEGISAAASGKSLAGLSPISNLRKKCFKHETSGECIYISPKMYF